MPAKPVQIGAAAMSVLSFVHYKGFTDLPEYMCPKQRLDPDLEEMRTLGIHWITV